MVCKLDDRRHLRRDAAKVESAYAFFNNSRHVNLSEGPSAAPSADDSALEVRTRFNGP